MIRLLLLVMLLLVVSCNQTPSQTSQGPLTVPEPGFTINNMPPFEFAQSLTLDTPWLHALPPEVRMDIGQYLSEAQLDSLEPEIAELIRPDDSYTPLIKRWEAEDPIVKMSQEEIEKQVQEKGITYAINDEEVNLFTYLQSDLTDNVTWFTQELQPHEQTRELVKLSPSEWQALSIDTRERLQGLDNR